MKKKNKSVMIPHFKTCLNQDSFEVFDCRYSTQSNTKIQQAKALGRDFLILFSSSAFMKKSSNDIFLAKSWFEGNPGLGHLKIFVVKFLLEHYYN